MNDKWLTERCEADRPGLKAVARRHTGCSASEADNAVQGRAEAG